MKDRWQGAGRRIHRRPFRQDPRRSEEAQRRLKSLPSHLSRDSRAEGPKSYRHHPRRWRPGGLGELPTTDRLFFRSVAVVRKTNYRLPSHSSPYILVALGQTTNYRLPFHSPPCSLAEVPMNYLLLFRSTPSCLAEVPMNSLLVFHSTPYSLAVGQMNSLLVFHLRP